MRSPLALFYEAWICNENSDKMKHILSGRPIGEPVAWYGPIVMNTRQELEIAFAEYRRGMFIKHAEG